MRILNSFPALLLLWTLPCPGQHVEVIPDIAIAEAEYRDANEACLQNDPNLERDLFTADPDQVRRRLHRAAGLRDDAMVKKARARLFGSWEMNWMAFNFAHDVALPGSTGAPVGFLMYPQAETSDGRIDSLDADNFKYEITSRETTA